MKPNRIALITTLFLALGISPAYGVTPAVVTVTANPAAFLNQTGTVRPH